MDQPILAIKFSYVEDLEDDLNSKKADEERSMKGHQVGNKTDKHEKLKSFL